MKKLIVTLLCLFVSFFGNEYCQARTHRSSHQKHEKIAKNKSRFDHNELQKMIEQDVLSKETPDPSIEIADVLEEAKSHIGKRYVWATRGPKTFDCSGYVYYVFKQFGMTLSPSSRNQYTLGTEVKRENAQPGDLIFFHSRKHPKGVGHVGIVYAIEGDKIMFIHASCKKGVTISELQGYYERNFVGIKRVL
ncbi:MAG: C40 family peptidase [Erysipelotrichales bacterium]|nr:C40 family peptidase [Erysipelotrichales bacterium]